jgi:hypothetical protein
MAIESTEKPLLYRVHLLVNKRICTSWVAALIRWQVANETRRENTEDVLDYAGSLHAVYRVCTHTHHHHTLAGTKWRRIGIGSERVKHGAKQSNGRGKNKKPEANKQEKEETDFNFSLGLINFKLNLDFFLFKPTGFKSSVPASSFVIMSGHDRRNKSDTHTHTRVREI